MKKLDQNNDITELTNARDLPLVTEVQQQEGQPNQQQTQGEISHRICSKTMATQPEMTYEKQRVLTNCEVPKPGLKAHRKAEPRK